MPAERRVARAVRLHEELHVVAVPRLREVPVRRELVRHPAVDGRRLPVSTRRDARRRADEHERVADHEPARVLHRTRTVIGCVLLLTGFGENWTTDTISRAVDGTLVAGMETSPLGSRIAPARQWLRHDCRLAGQHRPRADRVPGGDVEADLVVHVRRGEPVRLAVRARDRRRSFRPADVALQPAVRVRDRLLAGPRPRVGGDDRADQRRSSNAGRRRCSPALRRRPRSDWTRPFASRPRSLR